MIPLMFLDDIILVLIFLIVFIKSSPDIHWKCYKKHGEQSNWRKKVKIFENWMLSVIKVGIGLTWNGKKKEKKKKIV